MTRIVTVYCNVATLYYTVLHRIVHFGLFAMDVTVIMTTGLI